MAASGNTVNIQPFTKAVAITLSDATIYGGAGNTAIYDAFMVTVTGTLSIVDLGGNTTTLMPTAGVVYYIQATQYKTTGTTATGVVGLRW